MADSLFAEESIAGAGSFMLETVLIASEFINGAPNKVGPVLLLAMEVSTM
jgi:hypothetical protein